MLKNMAAKLLGRLGLVVQPYSQNPWYTLLGLKRLNPQSVIDVGANEGQFAKLMRKRLPGAAIYCFEPLPQPFAELSDWARSTRNVHVYNVALGETSGTVEMLLHADHSASSSLLATTPLSTELYPFTKNQQRIQAKVERLDAVLGGDSVRVQAPYVVKLDVQGFEAPVIRGGRSVFSKAAACIVEISLDGLYEGQSTFREIFAELDALSFRYAGNLGQVYAEDGHVIYFDAVFVRSA
jgi:FkbM family methyltransferase